MSGRNDLYDPPAGHSSAAPQNDRIAPIQQTINEVTASMDRVRQNLADRNDNIHVLQHKSDALNTSSRGFARRANQVRKEMWWKDMRMRICIVVGIIILLIVIIVPAVVTSNKNKSG